MGICKHAYTGAYTQSTHGQHVVKTCTVVGLRALNPSYTFMHADSYISTYSRRPTQTHAGNHAHTVTQAHIYNIVFVLCFVGVDDVFDYLLGFLVARAMLKWFLKTSWDGFP